MAAPGAAFAGQPGRRAGHRHATADPGNQPQAAGSDTARRLVRACLQRPAALPRSCTGHGQRAGLAGTCVAAGQPAERPARHPGCPGRAVHTAGRLARGGEHDHPQAGSVPRHPRLRRRARAAARQPICLVRWRAPRAAAAVSPATVASPAQVRAILTQVSRIRPELAAFFGCMYCAALRRKKPSPCAATTSSSRPTAAARLSSPPPARAPAAPGRTPASLMSRPVSSTAPTAPSASSPSRPS